MKRLLPILTVLSFFLLSGIAAEQEKDLFKISPDLALFGVFVDFGYNGLDLVDGQNTTFWVGTGAAYEAIEYYRLPDGSIYGGNVPGVNYETDRKYDRLSVRWNAGVTQGLLKRKSSEENLLGVFLRYRGRNDIHYKSSAAGADQLVFRSGVPDANSILSNAFITGIQYTDVEYDKQHKVSSGVYGEVSAEWGPEWLLNAYSGRSDYVRFNGTVKGFLPLFVLPSAGEGNLFSVYGGSFLSADYSAGKHIPMFIRHSFGGLSPRSGLGGAVRGVDDRAFDTTFKIVNNIEVRAALPSIVHPDLVPGIVAYFDSGYYNDLDSKVNPAKSGFLFTTGIGMYVNLLDFANIAVYFNYFLNGTNASGDSFMPFDLAFGLRF